MTELDDILGTAATALTISEDAPVDVVQEATTIATEDMGKASAGINAEVADEVLAALMARISPVGEAIKWHKVMLFGPMGCGKTVFSASAPRPLVVAVEPTGTLSLKNHPELEAKTQVLQFVSVYQVETLLKKILELGDAARDILKADTLVIDSFSEFQNHDLDDILKVAAANDASRNKYIPTGPDYNQNTEHMRQIGAMLEKIPMHVILTSHVKEEKDDATGRINMRTSLTPKLARTMGGKFDVVGYMSMTGAGDSLVRTLQCHPTNTIAAKTRVGGIPAVIENPTWASLFPTDKDN